MIKRTNTIGALVLAALTMAACAGSVGDPAPAGGAHPPAKDETAYLTIVGDQNLFLQPAERRALIVKYHDVAGAPLAGEISFAFDNTAGGAHLSAMTAATDATGQARIDLTAGSEAAFRVNVTAEAASGVNWRISVANGVVPTAPMQLTGDFKVESTLDIGGGLPGTAGDIVRTIDDLTDGPNDPATFVLDFALQNVSGTIRSVVNSFRPTLDGILAGLIQDNAPAFVNNLITVGRNFSNVTRRFGITSRVTVDGAGIDGNLMLTHRIEGVFFTINNVKHTYTMAALGLGTAEAHNVPGMMMGEDRLVIGAHQFPFSYGRVMVFALNNLIIPMVDPSAHNLSDLIAHQVDCNAVGQTMSDNLPIGSASVYAGACRAGIAAVGGFVEQKILSLDGTAAQLSLHGDSAILDADGDRSIDTFTNGLWEGSLTVVGATANLVRPNNIFTGAKMTTTTP